MHLFTNQRGTSNSVLSNLGRQAVDEDVTRFTEQTYLPSKSLIHVSTSISYDPLSRDAKVLERIARSSRSIHDPKRKQSVQEERHGKMAVFSHKAWTKKKRKTAKQVGIQTRTPPPVSCLWQQETKSHCQAMFAAQVSSPLVEEPARPLVRALRGAFLALHPVCQAGESGHAGSLARCASIGSSAATERLSDATEWVVGEVRLGGSGAQATSGTLLSSF
jgi:hypothetical protein